MKKLSFLLALVILMCATLCACSGNPFKKNPLVGTWNCSVEGETITIVLNEDGTGNLSAIGGLIAYDFNYTAEDVKLTFEANDDIFQGKALNYEIKDNKLTLFNDEEHLEFTRE